ncbi:MAG TPA: c-type cytochrome [Anaerolineae bacterium]|nr:c-type cytochrome [Anaerolineae bacterium]
MPRPILAIALIPMLALVACGQPAPTPAADQGLAVQSAESLAQSQARGAYLFYQGVRPLCHACHSLQEGRVIVGPSLAHVGRKGEERLRAVLTQPDAPPAEGFAKGVMPVIVYAKWLTEDQVTDLVHFLLTQQ